MFDIAFDRYFLNGLKIQTRAGRGSEGTRITNTTDNTTFPKDFLNSFLCNGANKDDLGLYLASKIVSLHREVGDEHIQLNVTFKDIVCLFPDLRMIQFLNLAAHPKKQIKK